MRCLRVLSSFLENFVFGVATSFEIASGIQVNAFQDSCHEGISLTAYSGDPTCKDPHCGGIDLEGRIDAAASEVNAAYHLLAIFRERLCIGALEVKRETRVILNAARDPEAR